LDEPLEAVLVAEFSDCQVHIRHGGTVLASSDEDLQSGSIETERLPFPTGTTDIIVDIVAKGTNPAFQAWWITNPDVGRVSFPVFAR
jgi:hypothetical protein